MGSDVRVQAIEARNSNGLVCRTALSLLSAGCLIVVLGTLLPAATLSQSPGTAAIEPMGTNPEALLRPTLKPGSRGAEVTELQATLKLLGYYGGTVDGVYGQSTASAVAQFQQAAGLSADGITGAATWNRLFPAPVETAGAAAPAPTPAASTDSLPPASGSASFPTPSGVSPAPTSTTPAATPRPAASPGAGTTPKPSKPITETRPAAASPSTATAATNGAIALPVLRQGMKGSAVVALQERLRSVGVLKGAADGVFGAETLAAVKAAQRRFKLDPDGVVGGGTWSALLR